MSGSSFRAARPSAEAQARTEAAGEFYDEMWRAWGSLESASPAAFHRRLIVLQLVAGHVSSSASVRVLEVGCGPGVLLRELAREHPFVRLHGADVSPESLRRAAQICPTAELFELDVDAPTFESDHATRLASFDVVIASEVLEHLADDRRAVQRLASLLAPGGRLIVTVPGGARTRFDLAIGHVRHYRRRTLETLLRDGGFEVEHAMSWGFPFHSLYRAAVRLAARITFERRPGPAAPRASQKSGAGAERPSAVLAFGYRAVGSVLKPLYYLNQPFWGSQLFAVARKARV